MRKALLMLVTMTVCLLFGCSNNKDEFKPVKPTDIISESDAEAAVGGQDLFLEHNAVVDLGDNTYKASYYPQPIGSFDPVTVIVTYPGGGLSLNDIKNIYTESYSLRDNKKKIRGIGAGAFVAFPTITIYEDGHLVKITAGSGDTKEQLDLLLSLGQTAVDNLHKFLEENK